MHSVVFILFTLLIFSVQVQAEAPPVKGRFYLYIDDSIDLFLNGKQIFSLHNNFKQTQTNEIELKIGDRIVANLRNGGGPRGFMLLFVSSDQKQAIRFNNSAFKILLDPVAKDFSADDYLKARTAKEEKKSGSYPLPFKQPKSEWVWGEMDTCTLGSQITEKMFQPRSP